MFRAEAPIIVEGRRFYPTRAPLPAWAPAGGRLASLIGSLSVDDVAIARVRSEVSLEGLFRPVSRPDLPEEINPRAYLNAMRAEAAVDGREIVEWMHYAAADNLYNWCRMEEYNRLGSQLLINSNDAYIPGVCVEDCYYRGDTGYVVASRGYGVLVTPIGAYNVPVAGKVTVTSRNLLAWGAVGLLQSIQWTALIAKWKELAKTPINSRFGFPAISTATGFLVGPQFVMLSPSRPAVRVTVSHTFTSSSPQTVKINLRDPNDFTRVLASLSADIPAGQSTVRYVIRGIPYVPPLVCEMQPQDNVSACVDQIVTRP